MSIVLINSNHIIEQSFSFSFSFNKPELKNLIIYRLWLILFISLLIINSILYLLGSCKNKNIKGPDNIAKNKNFPFVFDRKHVKMTSLCSTEKKSHKVLVNHFFGWTIPLKEMLIHVCVKHTMQLIFQCNGMFGLPGFSALQTQYVLSMTQKFSHSQVSDLSALHYISQNTNLYAVSVNTFR